MENMDNMKLKVDLHLHSKNSKGNGEIEDLLEEVLENNISIFSITEHDTIQNILKASEFAKANNIFFIPGVEITSTLEGRFHILAYGIHENARLNQLLEKNMALVNSGVNIKYLTFPSPEEVVDVVLNAGGIPILAHPGARFYGSDYRQIVKLMLERGIMGIECFHPSNSREVTDYCLEVCRQNDLYITGGSDYHGKWDKRKIGVPNIVLSDLNLKSLI